MPSLNPSMTIELPWRVSRGCAEAVSSCVTDAFDTLLENWMKALYPAGFLSLLAGHAM